MEIEISTEKKTTYLQLDLRNFAQSRQEPKRPFKSIDRSEPYVSSDKSPKKREEGQENMIKLYPRINQNKGKTRSK